MKLSIVIPVRLARKTLEGCVTSMKAACDGIDAWACPFQPVGESRPANYAGPGGLRLLSRIALKRAVTSSGVPAA